MIMQTSIGCCVLLILLSLSSVDNQLCPLSDTIYKCFCSTLRTEPDNYLFNRLVQCHTLNDSEFVTIRPLSCVTYDNDTDQFYAGSCPFTGYGVTKKTYLYEDVLVENLTETVCGKRSGRLCGECSVNHSLSLNTLDLGCIDSTKCKPYFWAVYVLTDFIGITIFYLLILFLNIRVTSECANGSLILAQLFALPINIVTFQRDWAAVLNHDNDSKVSIVGNVLSYLVAVVYGIWNLDIPTGFITKMCVPKATGLQVFAVQYLSSIYPLILIIISFLLIKLYECNFRFFILISKPCHHFWLRFRNRIDTRATIIDIFASFLILSYTKLTHISFILLAPTPVYNYKGIVNSTALLYDGSVSYFGKHHVPYAVLALLVLCLLVIPSPLLLMFYQFRWFQAVLTKCRLNSHLLTLFVNSFQRGYKDGIDNQTRDLRCFSAFSFFVRIIVFALYSTVGDYFILYYCLLATSMTYTFVFAVIRPFRCEYFNRAESCIGLLMSIIAGTAVQNNIRLSYTRASLGFAVILYILVMLPFLYMCTYFIVWFLLKLYKLNKTKILQQLSDDNLDEVNDSIEESQLINPGSSTGSRVRSFIRSLLNSAATPDTERVPDRLRHPSSYSGSGEYEWFPEEQYTDTGTDTNTATTYSTQPRSTYSVNQDQDTDDRKPINKVVPIKERSRPKLSLRSVQLCNLSEHLIPSQHNTN